MCEQKWHRQASDRDVWWCSHLADKKTPIPSAPRRVLKQCQRWGDLYPLKMISFNQIVIKSLEGLPPNWITCKNVTVFAYFVRSWVCYLPTAREGVLTDGITVVILYVLCRYTTGPIQPDSVNNRLLLAIPTAIF